MQQFRTLERTTRKVARHRNHLRFCLRCNSERLTPPSLKLRRPTNTETCERIVRKAEMGLLNERIRFIIRKIKDLEKIREDMINNIRADKNIPGSFKERMLAWDARALEQEFEISKERQVKKFDILKGKPWNRGKDDTLDHALIDKWVINKSSKPLTDEQKSLLARGQNYAISPTKVPTTDYIVSIESTLKDSKLPPDVTEKVRSEVVGVLRNCAPPSSNLNRKERMALKELQQDKDLTILPADKGKCLVVMDTNTYVDQANTMLSDNNTYTKVPKAPNIKKELIEKLRKLKKNDKISQRDYEKVYPTAEALPKFYGLPKIHKPGTPLRPIVSGCGTTTHPMARFLADILSPLMGHTQHHVKNSEHFVQSIKDMSLSDDEIMISYDVSALFTAVPVEEAIDIIRRRLQLDATLKDRTYMDVDTIIDLLSFCLNNTYFTYQGQVYKQTHGAAMGSPVSPIVANLYMEEFESRALASAPHPPRFWKRYVDDTFTIQKKQHSEEFFGHINSQDPHIKFTCENEENSKIAFLDAEVNRTQEGDMFVRVYRKPTHTNQYLNFNSHHPVQQKLGVVNTLFHRCNNIITKEEDKKDEKKLLRTALNKCGFPDWALREKPPQLTEDNITDNTQEEGTHGQHGDMVVLPYCQGTAERLKRVLNKVGVTVAFKPITTIRKLLCHPKDKTDKLQKCGTVYEINCSQCNAQYIGQTKRTLKSRLDEHKSAVRRGSTSTSGVATHTQSTGHHIDWENISVKDTEPNDSYRLVREAIRIRQQEPEMNRSSGYEVPHVYDQLLSSVLANSNTNGSLQ